MNEDDTLRASRSVRGRGTGDLAKSRFDRLEIVRPEAEACQVETEVYRDTSRTILASNDSPDVGFTYSLNPYRGCEHGCIYCYARPTHEYLGLSAGLDFETKIFAKLEAPKLLREALSKSSWIPQAIGISGVTDCYQPIEKKYEITRQCLAVLADFRNPAVIITKNRLVTRDIDVLSELARYNTIRVVLSITTLDKDLARFMEPRASAPAMRLKAVEELTKAGIPVSVNMAPIIPGLTDHEIPKLLKAVADHGAKRAYYTMVRLPYGVKDLFQKWLHEHYPMREKKVLNRIRSVRGGKLYQADFNTRMEGTGIFAEQVEQMFEQYRTMYNLDQPLPPLSTNAFRKVNEKQLSFF